MLRAHSAGSASADHADRLDDAGVVDQHIGRHRSAAWFPAPGAGTPRNPTHRRPSPPPLPPAALMCCAFASICAMVRAASMTDAPASPSASAAAAPMPRLAPVTIATFPARACIGAASDCCPAALWHRRTIGQARLPVSILREKQVLKGVWMPTSVTWNDTAMTHRRQQAAPDARRQRSAGAGAAPRHRHGRNACRSTMRWRRTSMS